MTTTTQEELALRDGQIISSINITVGAIECDLVSESDVERLKAALSAYEQREQCNYALDHFIASAMDWS
jgi:hypothetical protein